MNNWSRKPRAKNRENGDWRKEIGDSTLKLSDFSTPIGISFDRERTILSEEIDLLVENGGFSALLAYSSWHKSGKACDSVWYKVQSIKKAQDRERTLKPSHVATFEHKKPC